MNLGDSDQDVEASAKIIFEAHKLKQPLTVRELLTEVYALHFTVEAVGAPLEEDDLKALSGAVGRQIMGEDGCFPGLNEVTTVIFGAKISQGLYKKAQIIFPDVIVTGQTHKDVREVLIRSLSTGANPAADIAAKDP